MKLLALLSAALLIAACFFPWITVPSKSITITGVSAMNFGKPAYFHFILTGLTLVFLFLNKGWSQKIALFFSAFNVAWAIRNFALLSTCSMGECPEKQPAIYMLIPAAVLLLLSVLLWQQQEPPASTL